MGYRFFLFGLFINLSYIDLFFIKMAFLLFFFSIIGVCIIGSVFKIWREYDEAFKRLQKDIEKELTATRNRKGGSS